jgi:hypothetical protein
MKALNTRQERFCEFIAAVVNQTDAASRRFLRFEKSCAKNIRHA